VAWQRTPDRSVVEIPLIAATAGHVERRDRFGGLFNEYRRPA
jgi:hypothetical protein